MDSTQLHVAIVSSPGIGHLIPVLVLGNRLATHHNIKITILTITTNSSSPEIEFLKKFNKKKTIQIIPVPSVDISHLIDSNTKLFTQLRILVREALREFRSGIASMNHHLDALILEGETIKALRSNEKLPSVPRCPIYPIGPLRRTVDITEHDEVIQWLDKQNQKSILYVSFGSGGTLSSEQIIELAWGLELIHSPSDNGTDIAYLNSNENDTGGSLEYLPKRFLTRTKDMGLVVPMWVQQVEILSHSSVGGFISHCGWNSTIESLTSGVPMIAWPLHAEQKMNSTMLTEELGVAIRPTVLPTKKLVKREEIQEMVRILMHTKEEKSIRENVKKLKLSAENALSEGGSSYNTM
ncbi:hypothetical protein H5410_006363 [Solanum commersonii]|uniref:Glycosyltransferase n=1 Tax=Solanum commersonii TaxID=4109 RepID=A0A9J6A9I3_SOLCO|nr:hypothetical protein H5410_006363 [Solanum commersonii]